MNELCQQNLGIKGCKTNEFISVGYLASLVTWNREEIRSRTATGKRALDKVKYY